MNRLHRITSFLTKHLSLVLPAAMVVGFAAGILLDLRVLKAAILPLTFFLVFPMMVGLDLKKLFSRGNIPLQIVTLVLNFGIVPFAAFGMGLLFFRDAPYLRLGLLMAALLPTSGMTVTWTGLSRGNVPEAVKMSVIGLLAGSLATPFYVSALLGESVNLPVRSVILQILIVVALPLIAGQLLGALIKRKTGEKRFSERVKPQLPGISTVGVILLVFVAIALKARSILARPELIWVTLLPVVLLYLLNFILSTVTGKLLFRPAEAKALVYGTVMRNLSIALAVIMGLLGEKGGEAALIITWSYIVQVQSAALYVRLSRRFFKENAAEPLPSES